MAQIATLGQRSLTRVVSLLLLFALSSVGFAESEVAVLTIRKDNLGKSTTTELLPIARIASGRFEAIAGVEDTDTRACAPKNFRGWSHNGTVYDVIYRGNVIGSAIAKSHDHRGYSCSALCVVTAITKLNERAPGIRSRTRGFDPSGSFDESLTQFAAYSTTDAQRPYSTRTASPLTKSERQALEAHAKAKLAKKTKKASTIRVTMNSVESFVGSKDGDVNVFFSAVMKRPNGAIRVITSVVRQRDDGVFELIEDGDEDRGAAYYEVMDAADFNGDGISELLVIYHNYEFHEFQILQRVGPKFEIVHKGPSYGC
jgi:hypothetical protein